jgi:cell division protease FtsH
LTENRKRLDDVVAQLLERETLDEAEVYAAAGLPHGAPSKPVPRPRTEESEEREETIVVPA